MKLYKSIVFVGGILTFCVVITTIITMKVQFNNLFVRSAVALFVLSLFCVRAYAAGSYVEDPDAAV